jgi:MFS family permease
LQYLYGVAIVAMCADLTRGKGRFNALSGLIATALAVGGVIGPLSSGIIVQSLGFTAAFYVFAAVASIAAGLFVFAMPETRRRAFATDLSARHTWSSPICADRIALGPEVKCE